MSTLDQIPLGTPEAADTDGSISLFEGCLLINGNVDKLKSDATLDSGALEIGFDNTVAGIADAPDNVQTALEKIQGASGETNTFVNIGDGVGEVYHSKVSTVVNLRNIKGAAGVSISHDVDDNIVISGAGTTSLYENVKSKNTTPYDVISTDQIILADTSAVDITINLPDMGVVEDENGRVITIKNQAMSGSTELSGTVTIDPAGQGGTAEIEDDRTGFTSTTGTPIGPGSSIRLVWYWVDNVWWII